MQAKQSSGTVLFRAVVMLGFLGVIFYVAVSGNALPDAARKQIEKYLPQALLANKPGGGELVNHSSSANVASEAPLFGGPQANKAAVDMHSVAPSAIDNPAAPRTLAANGSALPLSGSSAEGMAPMQVQSSPDRIIPVGYQAPMSTTAAAVTPFSQVQDRLRQLGATYYLLETWGNDQQLFRFYCKMAVGGNANYTHCFEQISADPLQAMKEVLKQVEDWRAGKSVAR